jgi:hypothetical protein
MTNTENTAALPEQSDPGPVLKSDTLGRVRTPAERRRELRAEFERSGLSGKKFAALVGVKYSTFAFWLQQRRRQGASPAKPTDTVRWLEAVVEQAQSSDGKSPLALAVELPGGARVEIADVRQAALAAALLRALEKPSC